jgi:hypothetical protein
MKTPEYERQEKINTLLGGRVLAAYHSGDVTARDIEDHINDSCFEPMVAVMDSKKMSELEVDIDYLKL